LSSIINLCLADDSDNSASESGGTADEDLTPLSEKHFITHHKRNVVTNKTLVCSNITVLLHKVMWREITHFPKHTRINTENCQKI